MAVKVFQSPDQTLMLIQKQWAAQINPALFNVLLQGNLLPNVSLINGATKFNHYLGRGMLGWFVVDQDAAATIYRSAPLNTQTLTLTSSAACTVNLWIF